MKSAAIVFVAIACGAPVTSTPAADSRPSDIISRALTCEIGSGKTAAVVKALKAQGAKPGKHENDYVLAAPIEVFGLPVAHVNVASGNGEGPDSYVAIFAKANPADVASAAHLKPLAGGFVRDTKSGRLSADVRDRTDVWLTCTPTMG